MTEQGLTCRITNVIYSHNKYAYIHIYMFMQHHNDNNRQTHDDKDAVINEIILLCASLNWVWVWVLFNVISTPVGHLMPKTFFFLISVIKIAVL